MRAKRIDEINNYAGTAVNYRLRAFTPVPAATPSRAPAPASATPAVEVVDNPNVRSIVGNREHELETSHEFHDVAHDVR